jgi:hypothetical protein
MAKDLVRTQRYVKKFILMRANIQAVALKIQTLKSNDAMAQAMKGVTKAMATMNKQVRLVKGYSSRSELYSFCLASSLHWLIIVVFVRWFCKPQVPLV